MATYTLSLGTGRFALVGQPLSLGDGVPYATIVGGIVTEIHYGVLPESDGTTLYWDITNYDPRPEVDYYFSEVCQTFEPTAPIIPPGEVAPPYPPGTTPPVPGTPGYPPSSDPGPPPLASTFPQLIVFQADSTTPITTTAGALAEVSTRLRTAFDLEGICGARLQARIAAGGAAVLTVHYSLDSGATWVPLSPLGTGPRLSLSTAGDFQGGFLNIAAAARVDCLLTVFIEGTGAIELGNISMLIYQKIGDGSCIELDEMIPGCGIQGYPIAGTDFNYATYADFIAAHPMGGLFNPWNGPSTENTVIAELASDGFGPHLILHHSSSAPQNLSWTVQGATVSTVMMVASFAADLAEQTGDGLVLFQCAGIGAQSVKLNNGRIFVNGANAGPASDLCDGTPKQFIFTASNFSDGGYLGISATLYVNQPCLNATPTPYYSGNSMVFVGGDNQPTSIGAMTVGAWSGTPRNGDQKVYLLARGIGAADFHD